MENKVMIAIWGVGIHCCIWLCTFWALVALNSYIGWENNMSLMGYLALTPGWFYFTWYFFFKLYKGRLEALYPKPYPDSYLNSVIVPSTPLKVTHINDGTKVHKYER